MASSVPDPLDGVIRIEGPVSGKGSVLCNVSGEGSFSLDGPVPRKVSVERADPGKASVALAYPGKASVERADPGKASVGLEGSIPCKQASVGVKDPGSGFGTGSSSCEGSVPTPLDGVTLVQGKQDSIGVKDPGSDFGTGSSCEGSVPTPLDGVILKDSEKDFGCPSYIGEDDSKVSVPVEMQYPWIMERFRFRRILSFLASTRFYEAYVAMQSDANLVLDLKYLQRYLELCQWVDARNYILGILPYHLMDEDGRTLMDFLTYLMFMHTIATGRPNAPLLIAKFERSCRDPTVLRDANRARIMRTIVSMRSQQASPSIDWNVVGKKAAEIVRDFITQAPEFSDYLRLPRRSSNIHNVVNVLPHGFCPRRTRSVKKAGRVPASVIAKYFLPKGRLQPGSQMIGCSGPVTDPSAWLRSAIDEALQTGMLAGLYHVYPTGYAYNEGRDRKRSWSSVGQDLDAGSYPKRPRKAEAWATWIRLW